jgi:calcineurin-like phosphoesterase
LLVDKAKSAITEKGLVVCNASGIFLSAARLREQVEKLFDSGIDLVFSGEQALLRHAGRQELESNENGGIIVRPINLPEGSPGIDLATIESPNGKIIATSVAQSTGRLPLNNGIKELEAIFQQNIEKCPILVNLTGTDLDFKKAISWNFKDVGFPVHWIGSGIHQLSAFPELNFGSLFLADAGKVSSKLSIAGIAPEIWWKRKVQRIPVSPLPDSSPIVCDSTILEVDSNGRGMEVRQIRVEA